MDQLFLNVFLVSVAMHGHYSLHYHFKAATSDDFSVEIFCRGQKIQGFFCDEKP